MPIGLRHAGVASGPSRPPRDPSVADPVAAPPSQSGGDLRVVRFDEKILTGLSVLEARLTWQPSEQQGDLILIDRIVVSHDTFAATIHTNFWTGDTTSSANVFEFTDLPRDVADENPPVILRANQPIIVTADLGLGERANVHFWYRVGRLV